MLYFCKLVINCNFIFVPSCCHNKSVLLFSCQDFSCVLVWINQWYGMLTDADAMCGSLPEEPSLQGDGMNITNEDFDMLRQR